MKPIRRKLLLAAAAGAAALAAVPLRAQPARVVRIVVPFPAGGVTDVVGRVVAERMADLLAQPVIVENRPGAGGNIAAEHVARAQPDGLTLLLGTPGTNAGLNQALYRRVGYDHQKDFEPVSMVVGVQAAVVVNATQPWNSLREFLAAAAREPGAIGMATPGSGTAPHLAGELLKKVAGVRITHVPYKGDTPALTDLLGGQVQSMVANLPALVPHLRSGKLRALAVLGPARSPALPLVPTALESGYADVAVRGWAALFAPAGTPAPVVQRLNRAAVAALEQKAVRDRFAELGADAAPSTPEGLLAQLRSEAPMWARLVRETGATAD